MKTITLTLFALITCINNVFSQNESAVNSILWEISGKDLTQKSYLLGTFHGLVSDIGYEYLDTLPKYNAIFDNVEAVAIECNLKDESTTKLATSFMSRYFSANYPAYALLPDSIENFSSIFENAEEYHYVDSFIQNLQRQGGALPFEYQKLKPAFTTTILSFYKAMRKAQEKAMKNEKIDAMDLRLSEKAIEKGKRPFYMETAAEQFALLEKMDSVGTQSIELKDQAKRLYFSCLMGDSITNTYMQNLEDLYLKGDLDAALKSREDILQNPEHPMPEQFMEVTNDELVNDRNRRWISVIDANVHQGSCLIAVGALHLPGENGLINLLRKEGYTLNPVDIHAKE